MVGFSYIEGFFFAEKQKSQTEQNKCRRCMEIEKTLSACGPSCSMSACLWYVQSLRNNFQSEKDK